MARKSSSSTAKAPRKAAAAKPVPKPNAKGRLTGKQTAFAEHYALHNDPTAAYRHAYDADGMKHDTIRGAAQRQLRNPKIAALVSVRKERVIELAEQRFDYSAEKCLRKLAALADLNILDYLEWGEETVPKICKKTGVQELDRSGHPVVRRDNYVRARPSKELTRLQAEGVASVEISVSKTGDKVLSLKTYDRTKALTALLGHLTKNQDAPGITLNVAGAAQVVMPGQPLTEIGDKREALKQFEAMRAKLMAPKG